MWYCYVWNIQKKGLTMTKIVITLGFMSAFSGLYTMENNITLPSQQELKKRLTVDVGIPHFVETTCIDRKLGSTQRSPREIIIILDSSLQQYNDNPENNLLKQTTQNKRQEMIEAILQEHPQAIEFLKKNGSLAQK
jgi:hypothetical protein